MTIAKFAQVTRIQPCVQNLHEWYVQNLHKSLRESAARHPKKAKFGISPPEWRKEHSMKPFARINLSSAAMRRGVLVSSLAREGRGKTKGARYV